MGRISGLIGPDSEDGLICEGSDEALTVLYQRYRPALLRLCTGRLKDPHLAEDAVQESFIKAFSNLHRFELGRRFWPWLATIAGRVCIDLGRRQKAALLDAVYETGTETYETNDEGLDLELETPPDEARSGRVDDTMLEEIIASEGRASIERVLGSLPRRQRWALLLYADGWKYSDIAYVGRVSIGAVKQLLVRARKNFRDAWKDQPLNGIVLVLTRFRERFRNATTQLRMQVQIAGERIALDLQSFSAAFLMFVGAVVIGGPVGRPPTDVTLKGDLPVHPALSAHDDSSPRTARLDRERPEDDYIAMSSDSRTDSRNWLEGPPQQIAQNLTDPAHDATPENTSFESIEVSPDYANDHTILASGRCFGRKDCFVLFRSTDGGGTWERLTATSLKGYLLLLPPNFSGERIFAIGDLGLQESVDGGTTFQFVSPIGVWNKGGAAISPAFAHGDPRIVIANSGTGGVFEYWAGSGLTRPSPLPVLPGKHFHIATVAFSPTYLQDSTFLVGTARLDLHQPTAVYRPNLYRCRTSLCDEFEFPLGGGSASGGLLLSPRFSEDGVAYSYGSFSLSVSTDGAGTFQRIPRSLEGVGVTFDLAAVWDPLQRVLLAAVHGPDKRGGIFRSLDGGYSWARLHLDLPGFDWGVMRVTTTPAGRVLAGGGRWGIACSGDGGVTWAPRCERTLSASHP